MIMIGGRMSVYHCRTTPVGFEPTRGDPIGLAGRRLNRSAKVSLRCAMAVASWVGGYVALGVVAAVVAAAVPALSHTRLASVRCRWGECCVHARS
jgi:hypothetical protein